MSVVAPTLACLVLYFLGFRFYARFLGKRIFELDPSRQTPAHTQRDGVDYVPTRRAVVFGHHFASITGLAPMLGPAVAVIWGWLPAMLWVVLGAVFVGCVHDFAALVLSLRAKGMSIGKVVEGIVGPRAKTLFHLVIFFAIALAMGVFVYVIGDLFAVLLTDGTPGYPGAVTPSGGLMIIAVILGFLWYRKGLPLAPLAAGAFVLSLVLIWVGHLYPTLGLAPDAWPQRPEWIVILLAYAFLASVLPVWVLLQARDFVNSLLLYLGVGACYVGLFLSAPTFQAPAFRPEVEGAPSLFPFVFIIIACGAASGFHGLVSSGTTAKQLDSEKDAPVVGYGGMIAESSLGLLAVLATTAGFASVDAWNMRYADWGSAQGLSGNISAFISGAARFISALGVEQSLAAAFIAVVVVSFALTTLDSATRLLRYNIEEIGDTVRGSPAGQWLATRAAGLRQRQSAGGLSHALAWVVELKWWGNRFLSSGLALAVIAVFAFYKVGGKPAALALWTLFGTTNQLLAGLTLLAATIYLRQRGKSILFTGIPAVLILVSTLTAMAKNLGRFVAEEKVLLWVVGGVLLLLALVIVAEGIAALRAGRREASWEVRV